MKNTLAIGALLRAADEVQDPLDRLACQRAATWIRWCDGFGATLTIKEASLIDQTKSLGEIARMIIVRLSKFFPVPPEDLELSYIEDDSTCWQDEFRRTENPRQRVHIDNPYSNAFGIQKLESDNL